MSPETFVITVTEPAARRVREVVREHQLPGTAGLRVAAVPGGCSGLNYEIEVVPEGREGDHQLGINGVIVWLDPESAPALNGMTIDWTSSMQESRFVFINPNATGTCGCGTSFSV